MKLLTGNDLPTGDVIWWTGSGWSRHIAEAADVGTEGEALAKLEEAARRVNGPYVPPRKAPAPPTSRIASARSARPCGWT